MQTNFTLAQLADPDIAEAEKILRACVHCGFCTATCPTYVTLGDELDSPRGRIYLIKDMLERDRPAGPQVVKHIDRCLTCLSCMTTCPSGVNYLHLVDHARAHIETSFRRPWQDRWLRRVLAWVLPYPTRFRALLFAAGLLRPLRHLLPGRMGAMLQLVPADLPPPSPSDLPQTFPAVGTRQRRVALLTGCAQQVVAPQINEATIRLLTRHGCEVVVAPGAGCCGALVQHLGRKPAALEQARALIDAWSRAESRPGDDIDAIVINTSGCGTVIKEYGFLLRDDPVYAAKAARISGLARDVTEFLVELGLQKPVREAGLRIAYHAACSLQHGQGVLAQPKDLLRQAGFAVEDIPDGHLCCGSAGTYNLLQPDLAETLKRRKLERIETLRPDAVAAGNVGCITQLASGTEIPVLHTVELLDWATGGLKPVALGGTP
jgi:glycolate oxidase iron-sulfur subunit